MNVTIIGAGPAGLLLAHQLLSAGKHYSIRIHERLDDPRVGGQSGRGFVISLAARGQAHLKSVDGLWPAVQGKGVEVTQTGLYSARRHAWNYIKRIPVGGNPTLLINRNDLSSALLEQLAPYQDRCEISFNQNCLGIDLKERLVHLAPAAGVMASQPYDLLVGADGVHSVVRNALLRQPGFNFSQNSLSAVWKAVHVRRPTKLQPGTTYFFNPAPAANHPAPPGLAGAAMPAMNDSLCLLMFWQRSADSEETNPPGIGSPEDFQETLAQQWLPGLTITLEEAKAWFEQSPSRIVETRCSRYHDPSGRVALLGDAAHGMSSALAQGCQAGFADVTALASLLRQYPDDLPTVLQQYSRQQVREGHAITDLNAYLRPQAQWLSILFKVYGAVQMKIQRLVPRWGSAPLFAQLARPDIPYSAIAHEYRGWIRLIRWSNGKATPKACRRD
jgi:kynurenine 3-monooxygenase